jgi:metallo-beta-lactamase class B
VAALWGGTLFNFGPDAARFASYAESAARFRGIATRAGADVLLSNHTDYDGSKQKLPALAKRAAGAPHPYVVGNDSIRRYLTVANECAQAALATVK